jgi:hypothetical protein
MDVFSINNRQLDPEPPDPEQMRQWRENLRHPPPGEINPERIQGGII